MDAIMELDQLITPKFLLNYGKKPKEKKPDKWESWAIFSKLLHEDAETNEDGKHIKISINGGKPK
jgi:hypothetical protein